MLINELFSDIWLTNDESSVLKKIKTEQTLSPYEQTIAERMRSRGLLTGEEFKTRTIDTHWRF